MRVQVEVDSMKRLATVAGISLDEFADAIGSSRSLASLKLRQERPWYEPEIEALRSMLVERGVIVARTRIVDLIGKDNIKSPPPLRATAERLRAWSDGGGDGRETA